ncbi:MAG: hypothetical protein ACLUUO_14060 [Sellimonas intestinalis]
MKEIQGDPVGCDRNGMFQNIPKTFQIEGKSTVRLERLLLYYKSIRRTAKML